MTQALIFFGSIAVILWIVALLDWYGRRKDRRPYERT
jgi:hypothetical protein